MESTKGIHKGNPQRESTKGIHKGNPQRESTVDSLCGFPLWIPFVDSLCGFPLWIPFVDSLRLLRGGGGGTSSYLLLMILVYRWVGPQNGTPLSTFRSESLNHTHLTDRAATLDPPDTISARKTCTRTAFWEIRIFGIRSELSFP